MLSAGTGLENLGCEPAGRDLCVWSRSGDIRGRRDGSWHRVGSSPVIIVLDGSPACSNGRSRQMLRGQISNLTAVVSELSAGTLENRDLTLLRNDPALMPRRHQRRQIWIGTGPGMQQSVVRQARLAFARRPAPAHARGRAATEATPARTDPRRGGSAPPGTRDGVLEIPRKQPRLAPQIRRNQRGDDSTLMAGGGPQLLDRSRRRGREDQRIEI